MSEVIDRIHHSNKGILTIAESRPYLNAHAVKKLIGKWPKEAISTDTSVMFSSAWFLNFDVFKENKNKRIGESYSL